MYYQTSTASPALMSYFDILNGTHTLIWLFSERNVVRVILMCVTRLCVTELGVIYASHSMGSKIWGQGSGEVDLYRGMEAHGEDYCYKMLPFVTCALTTSTL